MSQTVAAVSAKCNADRQLGNLVCGQSFTICTTDCEGAPQLQDGSEACFQQTGWQQHIDLGLSWNRSMLSTNDEGCRTWEVMVSSLISEWLITSEVDHSSIHFCSDLMVLPIVSWARLDIRRTTGWFSALNARRELKDKLRHCFHLPEMGDVAEDWQPWKRSQLQSPWDDMHGFIELNINKYSVWCGYPVQTGLQTGRQYSVAE